MKGLHVYLLLTIGFFNASQAVAPALPYDPWYKGPDYNDVEDALTYKNQADSLSRKLTGKPLWLEPNDNLNYKDYHCVGAHNAHVYKRWFGTVYQHRHSTTHMLTYGIRGLMWDTYPAGDFTKQGPPDAKVIFAHGKPGAISFTQKGNTTYQTLQYELRRVVEFMKAHRQAVVTIILEDYANPVTTANEIQKVMKDAKVDLVFKPADYESTAGKPAGWPTLGWMRQNNKRLVIFTQNGVTTHSTFEQFKYCKENVYSTTDNSKLCAERRKSIANKNKSTREIVIFNNFSGVMVTHAAKDIKSSVEYNNVKNIMTQCKKSGWDKFNQYYADRIIDCCNELLEEGKKTIFQYVNELNGTSK